MLRVEIEGTVSLPLKNATYTTRYMIAHSAVVYLQVIRRASPYLARAILDKPQGHLPLFHGRYRTWEEVGAVGQGKGWGRFVSFVVR